MGNKSAASLGDAELFAFWSASVMKVPPPLRTSFGNFTTVNSVERFTLNSSTTKTNYVWIPWTPSPLAALFSTGAAADTPGQRMYNTMAASPPQCLRPLRMSFSVENLTQVVNTMGSIRVLSYDNALASSWTLNALSTLAPASVAGLDAYLGTLVDGAPETEEYTIAALTQEHEFVSCPSSYPAYNSYYDFLSFSNVVDGTGIYSGDFNKLVLNDDSAVFPGAATIITGNYKEGSLGGLPPMRGFVIEIPLTTISQSLRFSVHRQDGVRYPANSLGHSFAISPPKMPAPKEDWFLDAAKQVAQGPSRSVLKTLVEDAQGIGNAINTGLAAVSEVMNPPRYGINGTVEKSAQRAGNAASMAALAANVLRFAPKGLPFVL